jgi:hypothetical protein
MIAVRTFRSGFSNRISGERRESIANFGKSGDRVVPVLFVSELLAWANIPQIAHRCMMALGGKWHDPSLRLTKMLGKDNCRTVCLSRGRG